MHGRRFEGFVLVVACLTMACPTPAQEGGLSGIEGEGLARRLRIVCGSTHADPSCRAVEDGTARVETVDGGSEGADATDEGD